MFILIAIILIFIMLYRSSKGEGVYKFVLQTKDSAIEKYAPYSYKKGKISMEQDDQKLTFEKTEKPENVEEQK